MSETNDTTVICTYAPSGVGKTTDMGYSFPTALFAAAPGALNSVKSICGYEPQSVQLDTIEEATRLITEVKGKYEWLIIDDFSFMAEQSFSKAEKKYNGFKVWGALRDAALNFRNTARASDINVALNCWEKPPKVNNNGAQVRGGPLLSGRLPEEIPAMCDLVLRGCHDPRRKPWPAVYRCTLDPNWVMKDRFNIAPQCDPCPMNLGELLRARGINVPRHPDLPDQEEWVATLSERILSWDKFDPAGVNELYTTLRDGGVSTTVARWTMRDALDRAHIKAALARTADTFLDISTTSLL